MEVLDLSVPPKNCSNLPNFPRLAARVFAGLDENEKLFICGGRTNTSYYNTDCSTYANGLWNTSPYTLTEPRYFSAVLPFQGSLSFPPYKNIISGGAALAADGISQRPLNTLEVLKGGSWSLVSPPIPVTISSHCMVALNSSAIMVIGGIQNGVQYQAKTFILDINKCNWVEGPTLMTGRNAHRCARIATNGLGSSLSTVVIGGLNQTQANLALSSTEILDDGATAWRTGPSK